MTNWVVDRSLTVLRMQIDAAAPDRSRASDGTIGDTAHQATDSEHNPEHPPPPGNPDYQVDAEDYTHDPDHGADMAIISEAIRRSQDRRVLYVIFNRRIYSGAPGPQPWAWRPYTGPNPHDHHMHVSVRDVTHDQTQPWQITLPGPTPPEEPVLPNDFPLHFWYMIWRFAAVVGNRPRIIIPANESYGVHAQVDEGPNPFYRAPGAADPGLTDDQLAALTADVQETIRDVIDGATIHVEP